MIKNETFCKNLASLLGFELFADRGEFEAAYRQHNELVAPVCGIFKMMPMSITPVQGLFLASANASVEIAADKRSLALVRSTIDSLAENNSGQTTAMQDEQGNTYIVTATYSTAYVGLEKPAPNNIGTVIPVNMTVQYMVIQNGVSANDVRMYIDGHPVFVTQFSVSNQRVADSYTLQESQTAAVVTQSVRSFDFISPLLTGKLGAIYRKAIWQDDENTAHCFRMTVGSGLEREDYCYIVTFGNISASGQQPQNIGCNISLLEAIPELLNFDASRWKNFTCNFGTSKTLEAPTEGNTERRVVFWGDGTSEVWVATPGGASLTHEYAARDTYRGYYFVEDSYLVAATPDITYDFLASATKNLTLFADDVEENGFWRRNCTVDWGDGTTDTYNTVTATFAEPPSGISHTYAAVGTYQIKVYNNEEPLFVYQ